MNDLEMSDLEAIELENQQNDRPNFTPTPEQIRLACLEIQAEWSPEEERRRRVIQTPEAEIRTTPMIRPGESW